MIGENLVKFAGEKSDLDYTILRLTNVYGPEGDQYGAQIIIQNAISQNEITVMGGSQRLNYVYVDDVVEILNLVLTHKGASKQIFNVGSKDTISVEEFAKKVAQKLGGNVKIKYTTMRETETSNFEPSLKKLNEVLGYIPKTSIDDGLAKTIQWYKEKSN